MLILMFMSGLLVLFQYKYVDYKHNQKNIRLSNLVCNTIKELRNSAELRWIIIAFGMLQMYIQIHFQMWQSFFWI